MTKNILSNLPADLPEELFESLLVNDSLKIERIISRGHITPAGKWYDQAWDEWVLLLQGEALLTYKDGSRLTLHDGDYVLIPAHCKHRVEWTVPDQDTIWLAIHFKPA